MINQCVPWLATVASSLYSLRLAAYRGLLWRLSSPSPCAVHSKHANALVIVGALAESLLIPVSLLICPHSCSFFIPSSPGPSIPRPRPSGTWHIPSLSPWFCSFRSQPGMLIPTDFTPESCDSALALPHSVWLLLKSYFPIETIEEMASDTEKRQESHNRSW